MTKVMIVDDEKYVRLGIKNGTDWALINCQVVGEACNGQEGIESAEELRPDLIISDIKMPKKNGIEMAEELLDKYPLAKELLNRANEILGYDLKELMMTGPIEKQIGRGTRLNSSHL